MEWQLTMEVRVWLLKTFFFFHYRAPDPAPGASYQFDSFWLDPLPVGPEPGN